MSNTIADTPVGPNETPKAPSPSEAKPAVQENQGDGKPGSAKPEQTK
jgi:hypothetical protein